MATKKAQAIRSKKLLIKNYYFLNKNRTFALKLKNKKNGYK